MHIKSNIKLEHLVNLDYHILPVLNRFGICAGFGDKTIEQICTERHINVSFLMEIINMFLNKDYVPKPEAQISISELINYLKKTHGYYRVKLVSIEQQLNYVAQTCCFSQREKIDLVLKFFGDYKSELFQHINYEDQVLYPYIQALDNALKTGHKPQINANYSIEQYLQEHDRVEDSIVDIKTLILKYLPVEEPSEHCNQLLFSLFDFEKDLLNHQSIEERVLIPKVKIMEAQLGISPKNTQL